MQALWLNYSWDACVRAVLGSESFLFRKLTIGPTQTMLHDFKELVECVASDNAECPR